MKTLILYATKYGAAAEIARCIAEKIPGAVLCDLKKDAVPELSGFDCVIVGGSLYAGMLRKEARDFTVQNAAALTGMKFGLFLSGMNKSPENHDEYFQSNFPADIVRAAAAKAFLGGIYDPKKAGFVERLIFKAVSKQSGYVNTVSEDEIDMFIRGLVQHYSAIRTMLY